MIEPILVRRLSAITLFLALAAAALALAAGSPRVAGGVAAGAALGLLPILSWSFLGRLIITTSHQHHAVAPQDPQGRNGAKADALLVGLVSLGKLAVYAVVLYVLIGKNLVDPLTFGMAILAPGLFLAAAILKRRPEAAR
jgi:hypothetical protein